MKKAIWVAVGLLAISLVFFFLVRTTPGEAPGELASIPIGEGLLRIELKRPGGEEGAEHIVLDRRRGRWWLTEPVQAPLSEEVNRELSMVFGGDLRVDDLRISADRADELGLGEGQAVQVTFVDANKERGPRKIRVGDEILVAQTGARRTFIIDGDGGEVYRAHGGFGELLRRPVSELRSRSIISVGEEGLRRIGLRHRDGQHIEIEWRGGGWHHVERGLKFLVDQRQASRLANHLGKLRAVDFYQGPEERVGLSEPARILTVVTGEEELKLELSQVEEGEGVRYFTRFLDGETIYELSPEVGEVLSWGVLDLKDRGILKVGAQELREISLEGGSGSGLRLARQEVGWALVGGIEGELDQEGAEQLAQYLAGLRAKAWVKEGGWPVEDDIFSQSLKVGLWVGDEQKTLEVGGFVGGQRSARYARYSGREGLFILGESAWRRLTEEGLMRMVSAVEDLPIGDPEDREMSR